MKKVEKKSKKPAVKKPAKQNPCGTIPSKKRGVKNPSSKPVVVSVARVYACKLNAGNDRNGNPRRGWLVYDAHGDFRGFVDEGYLGKAALTSRFPKAIELCHVPTTPKAYRDAMHSSLK